MQTVELVGRLLISLAVVLGIIWLIARRAHASGRRKLHSAKLIDVLGRQSLSRNSSLAVVRIADKALIVGFNDSSVSVLGDLELDAVQARLAEQERGGRGGDAPTGRAGRSLSTYDAKYDEMSPSAPAADSTVDASTGGTTSGHGPFDQLTSADIDALRSRRGSAKDVPVAPRRDGALGGSALSPATWRQTIDALREMTVRKG